jgi:hypothetical protein
VAALGGRGYCWLPLPLIVACRHGPFAHVALRLVALRGLTISKLNFKYTVYTVLKFQDKDNLLRLMFAYTTSDVYLTLMFKLEIYAIYVREITIW